MSDSRDLIVKETAAKLSASEKELALQKVKAREIVSEVIRFGVTQTQILYIIRLLALELEDTQVMRDINDVIRMSEGVDGNDDVSSAVVSPKTKIYT